MGMFMPRKHQKFIQKPFNFDQNIHFMHMKIKNQNSWGIVSMQKLIMALVVISRLNMFQMCPILESLGLFNFHDGSQKISKIIKNLQKKNLKKRIQKVFQNFLYVTLKYQYSYVERTRMYEIQSWLIIRPPHA